MALEDGRRFPAGALPAPVAASWDRCRALGLDPRRPPEGAVLPFAEVRRRREALAAMRRLALAEMQLLHAQIAGSEFMIALGDADGIVLDTISDQAFAASDAGRVIIPGSRWREEDRGTNALGLAAIERAPVAIHGREHFFAAQGRLSCMAAPILGPDGAVLGLLDASCANEARQQHTLALVRMAAAQVENGLIYEQFPNATVVAFHPRPEYLQTLSAGLLALTAEGAILSLNRPAASLLAGLPARPGCGFDMLFETGFSAARGALLGGGTVPIRDRAGGGLFIACRQLGAASASPARARMTPPRPAGPAPAFVCEDPTLARRMARIPGATALRMPILILGETGTGKELMARHIHAASGRPGAFVALNCGAVPEALFAAELFGHARGAFTDAREGSPGLARAAEGGTLFLDEVAEIPAAAQAALLRFLDDGEARPLGAATAVRIDAQVVAATNRDLAAPGAGFRRDLLYRLGGLTLSLPPLRERADFAAIVRHLARGIDPEFAPSEAEIARLAARDWPGNIRELRSALRRAAIAGGLDEEADPATAPDADSCPACRPNPLDRERCRRIRAVFAATAGNVAETARRLGLSRTTVYRHLAPRD
jgi:transcriptional regulator of acetoin/glycerol metabolism